MILYCYEMHQYDYEKTQFALLSSFHHIPCVKILSQIFQYILEYSSFYLFEVECYVPWYILISIVVCYPLSFSLSLTIAFVCVCECQAHLSCKAAYLSTHVLMHSSVSGLLRYQATLFHLLCHLPSPSPPGNTTPQYITKYIDIYPHPLVRRRRCQAVAVMISQNSTKFSVC